MKIGGSPRPGLFRGLEGFGCQVHRPHVAADIRLWTRVGLVVVGRLRDPLSYWGPRKRAGAVRNPPGYTETPGYQPAKCRASANTCPGKSWKSGV